MTQVSAPMPRGRSCGAAASSWARNVRSRVSKSTATACHSATSNRSQSGSIGCSASHLALRHQYFSAVKPWASNSEFRHSPHAAEVIPQPRLRASLLFLGRRHPDDTERIAVAAQPGVESIDERTRIEGVRLLAFGAAELLRRDDDVRHAERLKLAM